MSMSVHQFDSNSNMIILCVHVPSIKFKKIIEAEEHTLIWDIKQQIIEEIGRKLKCPINYGFYLPPNNLNNGMFLDEWKCLNDYDLDHPMATLEFTHKRKISAKRKVHSKIRNNDLSLLFLYISSKNFDAIRNMISDGFDPNVTDLKTGETPLTFCGQVGAASQIINELYQNGAFFDYRNMQSLSALHKAAQYDHLDTVKTLVDLGSSTLMRDSFNLTPLYHAVKNSSSGELIKYLLDNDSPINCVDSNGNTELHIACIGHSVQIVSLLIHYGAEVNTVNNEGQTCLHTCVLNDKIKSAAYLIKRGINFKAVNSDMMTPLMLAQSLRKDNFINLLSFVENDKSFSLNMKRQVVRNPTVNMNSTYNNVAHSQKSLLSQMSINKSLSSIFSWKSRRLKYSITSMSSMSINSNYFNNVDSERTYTTKSLWFSRNGHKLGVTLRGTSKVKKIEDLGSGVTSIPSFNYIESVVKNSEEDMAGFKSSDFILEIDGVDVRCYPKSKVKSLLSRRNKFQIYKIASLNNSSKKLDVDSVYSKDTITYPATEYSFRHDNEEIIPPPFDFSVNSKIFSTSIKKSELTCPQSLEDNDLPPPGDFDDEVKLPKIIRLTQTINSELMSELKCKLKQRAEKKVYEAISCGSLTGSNKDIVLNKLGIEASACESVSNEDKTQKTNSLLQRANEIINQYKNSRNERINNKEELVSLHGHQKAYSIREKLIQKYGIDLNALSKDQTKSPNTIGYRC